MTGGYQILDLTGIAFTSGVAETIANSATIVANKKATMVSGLTVAGVSYPDFYAPFLPSEGNYSTSVTIGATALTIAVAEDNKVTVTIG